MLTNILLIIVIAFFVLWLLGLGLALGWVISKIAPEGEEIAGRGFVRKE